MGLNNEITKMMTEKITSNNAMHKALNLKKQQLEDKVAEIRHQQEHLDSQSILANIVRTVTSSTENLKPGASLTVGSPNTFSSAMYFRIYKGQNEDLSALIITPSITSDFAAPSTDYEYVRVSEEGIKIGVEDSFSCRLFEFDGKSGNFVLTEHSEEQGNIPNGFAALKQQITSVLPPEEPIPEE